MQAYAWAGGWYALGAIVGLTVLARRVKSGKWLWPEVFSLLWAYSVTAMYVYEGVWCAVGLAVGLAVLARRGFRGKWFWIEVQLGEISSPLNRGTAPHSIDGRVIAARRSIEQARQDYTKDLAAERYKTAGMAEQFIRDPNYGSEARTADGVPRTWKRARAATVLAVKVFNCLAFVFIVFCTAMYFFAPSLPQGYLSDCWELACPKPFGPFSTPAEAMASCFGPDRHCDFDQQAGALWDQRLKQHLLANGGKS